MNEEKKLKKYLQYLNEEHPTYKKERIITSIIILFKKQQKEIEERLKEIDSLYKMMSAKDERIEELYVSKDKRKAKIKIF